MVCKHSALFAVVVASALAGFSGAALSDDKAADKGGWAQPNVTGMPGYKEPPKGPDEPKAPFPCRPPTRTRRAISIASNPTRNKRRKAYANREAAAFSRPLFLGFNDASMSEG